MMGVWKSCEAPGSLLTTYLASIKYFDELDPNKRERSESNVEVLSIEQIPPYREAFMLVLVGVMGIRQEIGKYLTARVSKNRKDLLYLA